MKLLIEAPVNGGRNYRYRCSYVNKLGYVLETPVNPLVLGNHAISSNNPRGADNQQERPAEHRRNPQRLHAKLVQNIKPDAVGFESDDIVRSPWRQGGSLKVLFRLRAVWEHAVLTLKNGPKVGFAALVKSGHLLETPVNPLVLVQ